MHDTKSIEIVKYLKHNRYLINIEQLERKPTSNNFHFVKIKGTENSVPLNLIDIINNFSTHII